MKLVRFSGKDGLIEGQNGVWWHDGQRGPISKLPFIRQFGNLKLTKINIDDKMGFHLNDGIEIHYVKKGKYDCLMEKNKRLIELYPGDISITAPWQVHGNPSSKMDMGHVCWIVIKPQFFDKNGELNFGKWTDLSYKFQLALGKHIALNNGLKIKDATDLEYYFDLLTKELKNQEDEYKIKVRNLIENLLIDLLRRIELLGETIIESQKSFSEVLMQIIKSDMTRKWNITELAKSFQMGKTSFNEKVKKITGYSPNSFILNIRIDEAKQMLIETKRSLTDIAYNCGFSSLQHFVFSFKQRTGFTPKVFRNRMR